MTEPIRQILVADDSHEDVVFLREALQARGIESSSLVHVTDGESALAILSSGRTFDLAVIDYYLPKRTALEIAAKLKETHRTISFPLVVLTSYLPPARIGELYAIGINIVMQKPADWQGYQGLADALIRMMQDGPGRSS